MAVYELLKINEAMREEIRPGVTSARLHLLAEDGGMVPLTQNALLRARSKDISLAEVYRVRLG
jgi:type II secretory ATPase GspE/PulE/Tfp pilus assembly ATPase PilB-like protein